MDKLKNWLIKKLGGYTTADMLAQSAYHPVQFHVEQPRIETIKAGFRIPPHWGYDLDLAEKTAKEDIAMRIVEKMKESGAIRFIDNARMEEIEGPVWRREIIGTVRVVIPQEVDK